MTLTVTADLGYTEDMTLSIRAASYTYKDYSKTSQMISPYIGERRPRRRHQGAFHHG